MTAPTRRMPSPLTVGRYAAPAVVFVAALSVPLFTQDAFDIGRFVLFFVYCMPAMALNFASGYAGQLAFGQPVLMGLGAYASAILTVKHGFSEWVTVFICIAIAMVVSLIMGLPGLRVKGWYLAILTFFIIGVFPDLINSFKSQTGGEDGLVGVPSFMVGGTLLSQTQLYEMTLVLTAVIWLAIRNITKSNWGICLRQARDHSGTAEAIGINLWGTRVRVYLLMGLPCGLAGWLFAHTQNIVAPVNFSLNLILLIIGAVFLGGEGSLWGPIIGVAIFETITLAIGPFSVWNTVFLGVGVLASAVIFRGGVVGTAYLLAERFSRSARFDVTISPGAAARASPAEHFTPGTTSAAPAPATATMAATATTSAAAAAASVTPTAQITLTEPANAERAKTPLKVREVSKHFGGNQVLTSVDLDVHSGEVLGLIGPNGSGKTTLVNIITGILKPDTGSVEVLGVSSVRHRPHAIARLGVRRTFQHPQLVNELSVRDNVRLGACGLQRPHAIASIFRTLGERRRERGTAEQATYVCDLLGLGEDFLDTRVGKLSLGMKRVVEVGRALVGDPSVVCLDEPAAGLNDDERDALVRLIDQMRASGVALLLVEHNLELVMRTCDQVVLLEDGKISARARPREGQIDNHLRTYLGGYAIA